MKADVVHRRFQQVPKVWSCSVLQGWIWGVQAWEEFITREESARTHPNLGGDGLRCLLVSGAEDGTVSRKAGIECLGSLKGRKSSSRHRRCLLQRNPSPTAQIESPRLLRSVRMDNGMRFPLQSISSARCCLHLREPQINCASLQ